MENDNKLILLTFLGAKIENNRIISEEIVAPFITANSFATFLEDEGYNIIEGIDFNTSWDWIMMIVEKISKIENHLYPHGLYKYLVNFKIDFNINCVTITDYYGEGLVDIKQYTSTLIENVYNACLEFVKWYNENK